MYNFQVFEKAKVEPTYSTLKNTYGKSLVNEQLKYFQEIRKQVLELPIKSENRKAQAVETDNKNPRAVVKFHIRSPTEQNGPAKSKFTYNDPNHYNTFPLRKDFFEKQQGVQHRSHGRISLFETNIKNFKLKPNKKAYGETLQKDRAHSEQDENYFFQGQYLQEKNYGYKSYRTHRQKMGHNTSSSMDFLAQTGQRSLFLHTDMH